jgi:hypothetical protein
MRPVVGVEHVTLQAGDVARPGQRPNRSARAKRPSRTWADAPAHALIGCRRLDATPSGIWVADTDRYFLRSYGPDGAPQDSLDRMLEWPAATRGLSRGWADRSPAPGINALRLDDDGRLWVYVDRPRPDWQNAWRGISLPTEGVAEVRVSSLPGGHVLWRTTVEIIDPVRRRLIARKMLDGHVFAVLDHDRVATYEKTAEGIPIVTNSPAQTGRAVTDTESAAPSGDLRAAAGDPSITGLSGEQHAQLTQHPMPDRMALTSGASARDGDADGEIALELVERRYGGTDVRQR